MLYDVIMIVHLHTCSIRVAGMPIELRSLRLLVSRSRDKIRKLKAHLLIYCIYIHLLVPHGVVGGSAEGLRQGLPEEQVLAEGLQSRLLRTWSQKSRLVNL